MGNATQTGLDVTTGQECAAQLCFMECSCGPWRSYSPFPLKSWHLYMMGSFKMFWCLNTAEESTFCPWKLIVSALVRLLIFFSLFNKFLSLSTYLFSLSTQESVSSEVLLSLCNQITGMFSFSLASFCSYFERLICDLPSSCQVHTYT